MRHTFLVAIFCFIAAPLAHAQDAAPAKSGTDRVQIVEDDAAGAIRFVIDGKEVGLIDANGIHVDGLVNSENSVVFPTDAIPDWNKRKTDGGEP